MSPGTRKERPVDAKGERTAPVLSVKQVVKTFGEKRAVNGV